MPRMTPAPVSTTARVGASVSPVIGAIVGELGEPEVQHLHVAVGAEHDVLGLDIAVDDASRCAAASASATWVAISQRFRQRDAPAAQTPAERLALDELGRDEVRAVVDVHVVDGDDVRVIEAGGGARLLGEAPKAVLARRIPREQQLERDLALEFRVVGEIDLAHSAGTDQGTDFIAAEAMTGFERHTSNRVPRPPGDGGHLAEVAPQRS